MSTYVELFAGDVSALGRRMAVLKVTPDKAVRPELNHTALILDCSASMYGSLELVKDHARRFVSELDEKDYVSIIIFSGHDTAALISGPTCCDDIGRAVLDRAITDRVRIMGTTVFSEPLQLVLQQLKQSNIDNMASQAVLFTDGNAVPTRWGSSEEKSKAYKAAAELNKFGAAVSAIGYGYYYDEDFVSSLMVAGGSSGVFRHISDVEDFGDVIRDIRDTFARIDVSNLAVNIHMTNSSITGVYRVEPEVVQLSRNSHVAASGLYDGVLTLYLDITHDASSVNIELTINGEEQPLAGTSAQPLTPEQEADCIRVTAASLVLAGDTTEAIELLQQTGDDGVAETLAEAYTERDRRNNSDRVRRAFRDKRFIGAGLKPSGPNHCVLNVLRALTEDPSVVLSIPAGAYKRGGPLVKDPRVVASPLGSTVKVTSYTSHKDRFNFSVTTKKSIKVLPADDDGNIIDGATPKDAIVPRTYNVVRDGELVMKQLFASMAEATFKDLQQAGVIDEDVTYIPGDSYRIDLGDMKMVSSAWARPNSLRLVDLLREEADLMAEQTALNKRIANLGKPETPEFDGDVYNETATAVDAPKEYYTAPLAEVRLMKYKAQFDADAVSALNLDDAITRVKEVRARLRAVRFLSRSITFACHATGWKSIPWGEPKKAARSNKLEQLVDLGDAQLKLVTGEEKVAIS